MSPLNVRNYTFLGATQSLCPECLEVVPAKIVARGDRVYFRKRCPEHGLREDFVCSDRNWYDRYDYALPAKLPKRTFVEPKLGCPRDCGLCSDHEQHTCIGVLEITDNCNLQCPLCYAGSAPGLKHRSVTEVCAAMDSLVAGEGHADVLQLSGGEPTTHPELFRILDEALARPIQYVMLNTNGLRLAKDDALLEKLAQHRDRIEIYLQLDGLNDEVQMKLRGEALTDIKLRALERIGQAGLHVTIVAALQSEVNFDQLGPLLLLAAERPFITGLSLQPATYSGRYFLPEELERRITFPDVIRGLCEQSQGAYREEDFFPLPCAHPNCHILSLAYRHDGKLVPLTRFVDAKSNLDLLANGLSFTREEGARLVKQYLSRQACCGPVGGIGLGPSEVRSLLPVVQGIGLPVVEGVEERPSSNCCGGPTDSKESDLVESFFGQILAKQLGADQLLRITITSFLDAYNFDVRRVMKCCTHHVLPSGHIIPFCAYNVLYRNGKIPLPQLSEVHATQKVGTP